MRVYVVWARNAVNSVRTSRIPTPYKHGDLRYRVYFDVDFGVQYRRTRRYLVRTPAWRRDSDLRAASAVRHQKPIAFSFRSSPYTVYAGRGSRGERMPTVSKELRSGKVSTFRQS